MVNQPARLRSLSNAFTALRRAGAAIPAFSLVGCGAPVRLGWLRCCAVHRPIPAPPAGSAAPGCNSWPLPKSARWPLQTESRRAGAGRDLRAPPPLQWLARAGPRGWRSPTLQIFSLSPTRYRDAHFADAWRAPGGSLPPPQACESATARLAWPRARRVLAGSSLRCGVRPQLCSTLRATLVHPGEAVERFAWPTPNAGFDWGFSERTAKENSPPAASLPRWSNPSAVHVQSGSPRRAALPSKA